MSKNWLTAWARDSLFTLIVKWVWGIPVVTAGVYAVWAVVRGLPGPNVYLGVLAAATMTIVSIATIRGFRALDRGRTDVADIRALVTEYGQERARADQPRPTVEMLEQGRRDQLALIAKWRAMVVDIHARHQAAGGRRSAARRLIEEHPDFPSLRARLSPDAKNLIEGNVTDANMVLFISARLSESTYAFELRVLLDEIDRVEHERGLRLV